MGKFAITIQTDLPDTLADSIVRDGTRMLADQLAWGSQNATSIQSVRLNDNDHPTYLSSYELVPGDDS